MKFCLNYVCLALTVMASSTQALTLTPVPSANSKTPGFAAPNVLSPELDLRLRAVGSMKLDGATETTQYYGYINKGTANTMVPVLSSATAPITPIVQASKTEPDKNTYLVLSGQHGFDPKYNYGTHFLYQGHEAGEHGYITRINLDADGAHRVTLLADKLADGNIIPNIDGSTWNPFTNKLLFVGEEATSGMVLQATPDYPSTVTKLDGVIGYAGWEGVQVDSDGNLWLISDIGGTKGTINTNARQPSSFVYRFIPKDKTDLSKGGKLQALQVMNLANTAPIIFHDGQADADILSQAMKSLHTYKKAFKTAWVTIHNTMTDGFTPFDATVAAKVAKATPFKRPENGMFRPSATAPFTQFFFTETGDTNKDTQAGSTYGGFGAIFSLTQTSPSADTGMLKLFYLGNSEHSGFDNMAFLTPNQLLVVEDAGDTLHTQRNALDSGYLFNLQADYSVAMNQPIRFLAEGRDSAATLDADTVGLASAGDNEITGIHVSNGDASIAGLLGSQIPTPFHNGWRVFWTQQHGDNTTWEIVPNK